jgi:hypothetical protein
MSDARFFISVGRITPKPDNRAIVDIPDIPDILLTNDFELL